MSKGEQRKQDILDAASLLFFKKGYRETTVQDILDALSCSKGCFYHHFETKLDVLTDIARDMSIHAYESFLMSDQSDAMALFNSLLYFASPLQKDHLGLIKSLLAVESHMEGAVLQKAILDASSGLFYPSFREILERMRRDDLASDGGDAAMKICWHSFMCGCMLIIRETAKDTREEMFPHAVMMLRSVRQQMEDALGLAMGSVVILKADELSAMISALSENQAG